MNRILAAPRLSLAKANFCFGRVHKCGQVGKAVGILAYMSGRGSCREMALLAEGCGRYLGA